MGLTNERIEEIMEKVKEQVGKGKSIFENADIVEHKYGFDIVKDGVVIAQMSHDAFKKLRES